MDKDIFVKIFAKADKAIVNTDICLTNYYLEKGFNRFKSAELSESNILNFVEYANKDTFESRNNNFLGMLNIMTAAPPHPTRTPSF